MQKKCSTTFHPEITGKEFIRYIQAQIIYKHMNRIFPLGLAPEDQYKLLFDATPEQEYLIQQDVKDHLPIILNSGYRNAQYYLFENNLYKAPPLYKEHNNRIILFPRAV